MNPEFDWSIHFREIIWVFLQAICSERFITTNLQSLDFDILLNFVFFGVVPRTGIPYDSVWFVFPHAHLLILTASLPALQTSTLAPSSRHKIKG